MSTVLATTRQCVLYAAREIWKNGFVTFDTETTGLDGKDEIIQWAVCSQDGEILGSGYVKPTVPVSAGAFAIHGITEEQLANAPSFAEIWPTLQDLLKEKTVVIYNADFDVSKVYSSGRAHGIEIPSDIIQDVCAMQLFARFYGEVHEYYGTYTWQKLGTAIAYLNLEVPGQLHNAEHDATATALIIKQLAEWADEELPPGWHPPVNVPCAGCRVVVRLCAEPDEIWYCQKCGMEHGVFHECPGCAHVVEVPATGFICDDLCSYCHQNLHQEEMLLTGQWHRCPDSAYHIVETADRDEPCEHCKRVREWKRKDEETRKKQRERIEHERKERRRAYAKEYRRLKKEREQENRRRAEAGLPPLETKKAEPAEPEDVIIKHRGHEFQRQKDQHGRYEVACLRCQAVWSTIPRSWCAGIKTYRAWAFIPDHLKTRTQLHKERLRPVDGQKPEAVMDGSYDRYELFNKHECTPIEPKRKTKEKPSTN
jgi:DNA polymerase-3 subunit epsilon